MYKSVKKKIYGTWWEQLLRSEHGNIPEQYKIDNALLELFLDRLGCATVVKAGDHKAIFDRKFKILDPNDYSRKTKLVNGELFIPDTYASFYLGEEMEGDGEGYFNVSAWCKANPESRIVVTCDEKTGLAVIAPPPVAPITRESDPQLLDRLDLAFNDPMMPEPKYNNSEQSRQVIEAAGFPRGEYDWMQKRYTNLYSPEIVITKDQKGRTVYYIAYEHEVTDGWNELSTETVLKRSYDHGETWQDVAVFDNARWTILFELKGKIYMMGTKFGKVCGNLMIARWDEEANALRTAAIPNTERDISNPNRSYMVHNGRIYLPTSPRIFWADVDSDLMNVENWHCTDSIQEVLSKDWFLHESGCKEVAGYWILETNLVERNGELFCMMRLECQPNNGFAGLVKIHEDGKTVTVEETTHGLVEMPTTVTKFQVNYDEKTGLYLALANYPGIPMPITFPRCHPPAGQRNILGLVASPDLVNWKLIDILLVDRCVMTPVASSRAHAFQYTTWDIDGDDMVYFVREASDYVRTFHDGEFATLYRLKDYAKLVNERYGQTEFWKNPQIKRPQ